MISTKTSRFKAAAVAFAAVSGFAFGASSAFANSAAIDYFRNRASRTAVPSVLSLPEREYYREVRSAIDSSNWARVQELFNQRSEGLLHQQAKAEYYLAAGSPKIELPELQQWLNEGTHLPRAEQISRLAARRGLEFLPAMPTAQRFQSLSPMPNRCAPAVLTTARCPRRLLLAFSTESRMTIR